jgi:c(7)-type cytochrome triheme protein
VIDRISIPKSSIPIYKHKKIRKEFISLLVLVLICLTLLLIVVLKPHIMAATIEDSNLSHLNSIDSLSSSQDFSKFTHTNAAHARLPCLLCHRREDNSARPTLPGHPPCTGCHAQEFSNSNSPICTICHTKPGDSSVKPFPSLKSFNAKFNHAVHMRGASQPKGGCTACHKITGREGAAQSIPTGFNAHNTCYQCHTPRAQANGRDISSCGTCHQLGRYVRPTTWSRAYNVSFRHEEHGAKEGLSCRDCHNVIARASQSKDVTSPAVSVHFQSTRGQSCMTCHNDKRAFGDSNFANCKKCHQGPSFRF